MSCSGRVCDGKSSSDGLVGCPTIGCIQRMKLHASTRVSMSSKFWKYTVRYNWARFVPRPQAHSIGKVYAGLGHPNTFLWSTCSEQRQTAVLHRFNFCMFCSKNSWTCVKQQGNQGSIVTHSKNLKDMWFGIFFAHVHTLAHPHSYVTHYYTIDRQCIYLFIPSVMESLSQSSNHSLIHSFSQSVSCQINMFIHFYFYIHDS